MSKIEEVARAISKYLGENPDEHDNNVADGLFYANWTAHQGLARAAIEAMKEPTEAMSKAAYEADGTSMMLAIAYEDVWREMIDAALAEGPK